MKSNALILRLSIPLSLLIAITSLFALFTPEYYARETLNWQVQSIGQDIVDICVLLPTLIISSLLAARGNRMSSYVWGGTVIYLTYTYILFCFDVQFTQMFLLYCWSLGLSFASVILFIIQSSADVKSQRLEHAPIHRIVGWYFITIAVLFYALWMLEVIPATIHNTVPKSVSEAGLATNGVHVLDLSIVLPTIFVVGIGLLRKNMWSLILAPAVLCFFVLMDITIGSLSVIMSMRGLEGNIGLTAVMLLLAAVSGVLFVRVVRVDNKRV